MVPKAMATDAAVALITMLKKKHGPVMFNQPGGCCDNSAANCYLPGELTMGAADVYLGDIGGSPFSLEGPEGEAFHTRSRLFTDAEFAELQAVGSD